MRKRGRPTTITDEKRLETATKERSKQEKIDKFNKLCEMSKFTPEAIQESNAILMNNTIKEGTRIQYCSNLQPLRKWICKIRGYDITSNVPTAKWISREDFTVFLAACLKTKTLLNPGIRCSLLKEQEVHDLPTWAGNYATIKLARGFFYEGGQAKNKPLKGSITPEMMSDLLNLTIKVAEQYGAALRGCQLIDIQKGDYEVETRLLTIRKDKRFKAANCTTAKYGTHTKKVLCDHAHAVLTILQQQTSKMGELLFPVSHWNYKNYSKHFKSCAIALQWNPLLKWDGAHILRHGGTNLIIAKCNTTDINVLKQACVMCPQTIKRYGEDLASRILKVIRRHQTAMPMSQQTPLSQQEIKITVEDVSLHHEIPESSDEEEELNYSPDESETD